MEAIVEQRTAEWHKARKGRITASMVGAILGMSPYMSRNDAMRVMVRTREGAEQEFTGNIATEWGNNNEDGARIEFEMETGLTVDQVGFIPLEDWAGISPDALIGDSAGVEIKCPFGLRKADAPVPFKTLAEQPHYEAQVQFSLYVTGREKWHFFQWAPNGTVLETIYPDLDWQARHIPALKQFYAEFLEEPADDHLAPKRVEIDSVEAHQMIAEWDELAEQIERASERKKDLLEKMVRLGGGKNALIAGRKLTLTRRDGAISYAKALKKYAPDADLEPFRGKSSEFWGLK